MGTLPGRLLILKVKKLKNNTTYTSRCNQFMITVLFL